MKDKLIIFGTGKISEAITYFFERDSNYEIYAYICDDTFVTSSLFMGKPVIPLSKFDEEYSTEVYTIFVAVGYQGMNKLRTEKVEYFKKLGFSFAKYISPNVIGNFVVGDNSIVMDNVTIQPFVKFGDNVFVWGGAMIGHHAVIEDNVWLTGGCMIGGITKVGKNSFLGLGSIVGNEIVIGEKSMLGAGIFISKSIPEASVFIAQNTDAHRLNSDQFIRMSSCFKV